MKGGEELDDLDRYIADAMSDPAFARAWNRRTLRDLLPRKTRVRLWFTRRIDGTGIWLACHGQFRAAEALWRATRPVTAPRRAR